MGAWGPAIFDDDEAADVRQDFALYIADKQDVLTASDDIVRNYGASFEDPRHHTSFWLSLALTQWAAGWIDERVQAAAMRIIDEGLDLAKWDDSPLRDKRAKALAAARVKLASPPRVQKPFPKPWPTQSPGLGIGEILTRRLPNGRIAVAKLIAYKPCHSFKVRGPVIRLQHWLRLEPPSTAEAMHLQYLRYPLSVSKTRTIGGISLTAPRYAPLPPDFFIRTGVVVPPSESEKRTSYSSISNHFQEPDEVLAAALERYWDDPRLTASAPPPWVSGERQSSRRRYDD